MLDFRIETFLVLCRTMSYTQTAQILSITQPTVTGHIKYLESHYGCNLFHYSGRILSLTEKGEELLHYAQAMHSNSLNILKKMEISKNTHPCFRIGATKTIGEFCVPQYIKRYLNAYPSAKLDIVVDNTHKLLKDLDNGNLDFILVEGFFDKAQYEYKTIKSEQFIGVSSKNSPIANTLVNIDDLLCERLILREEGSGTREILEQVLWENNISIHHFKSLITINNFGSIKQLVKANVGITFLYYPVVEQELQDESIIKLNIKHFNIRREFNFVCLKNSLFLKEYQNFINL